MDFLVTLANAMTVPGNRERTQHFTSRRRLLRVGSERSYCNVNGAFFSRFNKGSVNVSMIEVLPKYPFNAIKVENYFINVFDVERVLCSLELMTFDI